MSRADHPEHWHRRLFEHRGGLFAVLVTIFISIGGMVEIIPMYSAVAGPDQMEGIEPYTPLELHGRDLYVREGCYNCHSQMVRPFRSETLRYGPWSRAGEYVHDRPFQLGSRRIGPDLHRVGGKYPHSWHYEHMLDPRSTSPGSVMPPYPWLHENTYDVGEIRASMRATAALAGSYNDQEIANVEHLVEQQAAGIVEDLRAAGLDADTDREIVALIAYLQRLGTDGRAELERHEDNDGDGSSPAEGDCDDRDPEVHPGAEERCNGEDDNCDGALSPEEIDADGDSYAICEGDCDDTNADIHPGATEVPYNGVDDNCDGHDVADVDGDGHAGGATGSDCDDDNPDVFPGALDVCGDGIDQDCSGEADDDPSCIEESGCGASHTRTPGATAPAGLAALLMLLGLSRRSREEVA